MHSNSIVTEGVISTSMRVVLGLNSFLSTAIYERKGENIK